MIGEGTYAVVFLGTATKAGEQAKPIAIKAIKPSNAGLDLSAVREIKYLRELRHPNIIALLGVYAEAGSRVNLVLEFLDSDLEMVIKHKQLVFSAAHVKSWMLMMLRVPPTPSQANP